MSVFSSFGLHGALARGYRAWLTGDLERAGLFLEKAARQSPPPAGALLHLSRVLSEQNRPDHALERIDEVLKLRPAGALAPVFRAFVLYDHQGDQAARDALTACSDDNLLAVALRAILDLKEKLESGAAGSSNEEEVPSLSVRLPLAARWLSEVTGRVLAPLEKRFLDRSPEECIQYHHKLFAPEVRPPGDEAGAAEVTIPATEGEWAQSVEDAFCGQRYDAVTELCREGDGRGWTRPVSEVFRIFSLLALDEADKALEAVSRCLLRERSATDLHFLQGLCHVRLGNQREAAWAFARAARSGDIEVDEVLQEISRRLQVRWELFDSADATERPTA